MPHDLVLPAISHYHASSHPQGDVIVQTSTGRWHGTTCPFNCVAGDGAIDGQTVLSHERPEEGHTGGGLGTPNHTK